MKASRNPRRSSINCNHFIHKKIRAATIYFIFTPPVPNMKLNQIHLHAIDKLFRFFQLIGLSLWKTTFIGVQKLQFSIFGLIFSIIFILVVICAIITSDSNAKGNFDTLFQSFAGTLMRYLFRFLIYLSVPVVYFPIWLMRWKMRKMHEKINTVKSILNELDPSKTIPDNFLTTRLTIFTVVEVLIIIILTLLEMKLSSVILNNDGDGSAQTNNLSWDTLFTYVIPDIFKNLCILHLLILTRIASTRFQQAQELLDNI